MPLSLVQNLRDRVETHRSHRHLSRSITSENGMGQHYTDPNHPVVRRAVQLAKDTNPADVLDVGTGRGLVPKALAKETGVKNIFATDINEVGLKDLSRKTGNRRKPPFVFPQFFNVTENLPKRWKQQFDMVVSKDVLPFLPPASVQTFFNNIASALKPGGWALFSAPSTESRLYKEAAPFENPNGDYSRRLGPDAQTYVQTSVESFNFTNPERLVQDLNNVGLRLTEVQPYGREKGWLFAVAQKPAE